ncbi:MULTISPECIES: hypothetical protein [Cyanophyceae]|uniref:Uncharacterized protein n=1 Tax=Leptolyngbya subtilissima DQ-A4 TaxID=2933933 RepID=A0ABV0KAA4_9CYAN|nr:hypothetical protein [Nodosilinea sp. FACHB-141]MBD2115200.1 hypothetical protein [Nodosilinea sp. FACHB-141]
MRNNASSLPGAVATTGATFCPDNDQAEQLCLFDVEGPGGTEGDVLLDDQVEALVTKVLNEVPKEDQRYFLLRFRFKALLEALERFSQREREQFTVWLVEAVLKTPEEHNETKGNE